MFVATVRSEYRTFKLPEIIRFSAVGDKAQYRRILDDASTVEGCFFKPTNDLTSTDPQAYQLLQCDIDGHSRSIRREHTETAQTYTVSPGITPEQLRAGVNIAYTVRTLIRRHGHLFFLGFDAAKGLRANVTYTSDCGIREVNFLDFIATSQQVRLAESPNQAPTRSVRVSFDGWTLPRSGAAVVWVLDRELQ